MDSQKIINHSRELIMPEKIKYLSFLLLIFFIWGCSSRTGLDSYMREDIPLDFINKAAVLSLQNNTDQKYAHKLIRDALTTQILAMGLFETVDQGVVDDVLHEEAVKPGEPLNRLMLQRLGKRLDCQAVVMGDVNIFGTRRVGSLSIPEISVTLRLVDTKSGIVIWQASGHNDGDSILARLFGVSPPDTYKVTRELVRELLYTIPVRVEPVVEDS